jgi:hypothetical protein
MEEPLPPEINPLMVERIYEPLTVISEIAGIHYTPVIMPPAHFVGAREFFRHLWECCDETDAMNLATHFPEGAHQLCYLMWRYALPKLPPRQAQIQGIETKSGKPFAVLATIALEELDEVETLQSGQIPPPPEALGR